MTVDVLYFDGCPGYEQLLARLHELIDESGRAAEVRLVAVETPKDAVRHRFLGSPTVRVDGCDVETDADRRTDYGLKCRLYRSERGQGAVPPDEWIVAALAARGG